MELNNHVYASFHVLALTLKPVPAGIYENASICKKR